MEDKIIEILENQDFNAKEKFLKIFNFFSKKINNENVINFENYQKLIDMYFEFLDKEINNENVINFENYKNSIDMYIEFLDKEINKYEKYFDNREIYLIHDYYKNSIDESDDDEYYYEED